MNKTLLLAGVAACMFAVNANAVDVKPYVSAKVKYVDMTNDVTDDYIVTAGADDEVFGGSIAVGLTTKLNSGAVRTEIEYNKNGNAEKTNGMVIYDADANKAYFGNGKIKTETQSVMANFYYDFDTGSKFTPYVGAGIGYSKIKVKASFENIGLGSMDDTNFAWQAGFGGAYALNDNVSLDAGYRYADYGDFSEDGTKVDTSAHELYLGARYAF